MWNALAVVGAVDIHLAAAIGAIKQASKVSCFAPAVHIFEGLVLVHALSKLCKVSGRYRHE